MAGFYYFLPEVSKAELVQKARLAQEILTRFGLVEVFGRETRVTQDASVQDIHNFQGQFEGSLIYLRPVAETRTPYGFYRTTGQCWTRHKDYWIGYDEGHTPGPADLERPQKFARYEINDSLDEGWAVPVIRSPDPQNGSLPMDITFDQAGEIVQQVKAIHQELWELSGQIHDKLCGALDATMDEAWFVRAAIKILQLNYRIGTAEIAALAKAGRSILDTQRVAIICRMTVEFDLIVEVQKKTEYDQPESMSSLPGQEVDCLDTDLAAAP